MEYREHYHFAFALGSCLLQALATEYIGSVKMVYVVLHSTDPAELVSAFYTYHVVAASLFLVDNQTTLRTIGNGVALDAF